jgi:hypothetical protein
MMTLWDRWAFEREFAVGVIDQRSDEKESIEEVVRKVQTALKHFPPERLLLTSECRFQHVPLEITRGKPRLLVEAARHLRAREKIGFGHRKSFKIGPKNGGLAIYSQTLRASGKGVAG